MFIFPTVCICQKYGNWLEVDKVIAMKKMQFFGLPFIFFSVCSCVYAASRITQNVVNEFLVRFLDTRTMTFDQWW